MDKLGFGELEFLVLKTVRQLNGSATVCDVCKNLDKSYSYTTIMTVMSRLASKGNLVRRRNGKQYTYLINNSASKTILKRIKEKIFADSSLDMVSYLLDIDEKISEQELDRIEKLIQKKRKLSKSSKIEDEV